MAVESPVLDPSITRLRWGATRPTETSLTPASIRDKLSAVPKPVTLEFLGLRANDGHFNLALQDMESVMLPHFGPVDQPVDIAGLFGPAVTKEQVRDMEDLYHAPSYDPEAKPFDQDAKKEVRTVVINDDEKNPANAIYISQSMFDLPPRWKDEIYEIGREAKDAEDHRPLRERLKSTFKKVIAHIDDGLQPKLMPGVEATSILDTPEPLSDAEIKVLLANPNKQFVAAFLTLCLTMQNPEAPIFQPVDSATPLNTPTGQVVEAQVAPVTMAELVATANAATVIARTVGEAQKQAAEIKTPEAEASAEAKSDKEIVQELIALELKKHNVLSSDLLAYSWATAQHETAGAWKPVVEGFFVDEKFGLPLGTTGRREAAKRGYSGGAEAFGRGIVMLTHDYNYKWMGEMLGIDLVANPDLMLKTDISVKALIVWEMNRKDGYGKTVFDYVNEGDFVGARRPVNGSDRARHIAQIADDFLPEAREMIKRLG